MYDHHFGEPCLVHGTTCFLHIDLCYAHNPFPSMTILGHHLVSDEVVCDSATFSLRSPLFPFHQVVCVKVDVKWDLQARCQPFIDVVVGLWFSLEKSPGEAMSCLFTLCMPNG